MAANNIDVVAFFLSCIFVVTFAIDLDLRASPHSLQPGLTPNLTLTCDVTDGGNMAADGGMIVGRDLTDQQTRVAVGLVGLVAMEITRDGVDTVAAVNMAVPAHALADPDVEVTGSVSGASGVSGHLSLTWLHPTKAQSGNYTCIATGLDYHGHSVSLNTPPMLVAVAQTTVDDLIPYLNKLNAKINDQQTIIDQQRDDLVAQMTSIEELQTANSNLTDVIRSELDTRCRQCDNSNLNLTLFFNSTLNDLRAEFQQTTDELRSQLTHIETGTVKYSNDHVWPVVGWERFQQKTVKFAKPYPAPPVVHLGVSEVWYQSDRWVYWQLGLVSVDSTGFTVGVRGKVDQPGRLYQTHELNLDWVSLPQ